MKIQHTLDNIENGTRAAVKSNTNNQTGKNPANPAGRGQRPGLMFLAKLMLGTWFCFVCVASSRAFSLYDHQMNADHSPLGTLSDVTAAADVNDHWTWVPIGAATTNIVITYKFDQNFINFFGTAQTTAFGTGLVQIEDQVSRALNQWSISSGNTYLYNGDPSDNLYGASDDLTYKIGSYARQNTVNSQPQFMVPNNFQTFEDIRSATLHELGHVFGLAHPDPTGVLNFRIYPHNSDMAGITGIYGPGGPGNSANETLAGNQTPTGGEVMSPFEGPGWINHILSWDDLDGYNISYSTTTLTFQEVDAASPAQIVFTTYYDSDPTVVATGTPYGIPQDGNLLDGVLITNGIVEFNTNCMYPIGFARHGINWNITPGQKMDTLYLQIRGSDNLDCASYNGINQSYLGPFATVAETQTSDPVDGLKNDTQWKWTGPSPDPITATEMIHVGFSLDVQDWTIADANLSYNGGSQVSIPFTSIAFEDFWPGAPGLETALMQTTRANKKSAATCLTTIPSATSLYGAGGTNSVSHGFSLLTPKSSSGAITISGLQIADVTGMGLTFSNLTTTLLNQLATNGSLTAPTNFGTHTLQPGQQFAVVLQGGAASLSSNILTSGNYLVYSRPDLAGKELFAYWKSTKGSAVVENFALAGEPPIVTAPVPALTIKRDGSTNALLSWPTPSTGFVPQASSSLNSPNWTTLPAQPAVVNNIKQEVVPVDTNHQFFRLKKYTISH